MLLDSEATERLQVMMYRWMSGWLVGGPGVL
jgi:hypothetical protein